MENVDNPLCILCSCPIWDKNTEEIGDTTKEILSVIFMNKLQNWSSNKGQVICRLCSRKIQDNFNFKCMCIYTEDFLTPFASVGGPQINLREVYKKQNVQNERDITDHQKVCRLCLQLVNSEFSTSLLEKNVFDMIQKYMPDIAICNTFDPVACESCVKYFYNFTSFIIDCVSVLEKNKKHENDATYNNKVKLETSPCKEIGERTLSITDCDLHVDIKNEDEFWEEKQHIVNSFDFYIKNEGEADETGCYPNRSSYLTPTSLLTSTADKNNLQINTPIAQHCDNTECKQNLPYDDDKSNVLYDLDLHMIKSRNREQRDTQKQPPHENHQHNSFLKKAVKTRAYNCEQCCYHTKYHNALKSHMLNHRNPSEIELYVCEKCEYKTKYRNALKSHQLNHKLPSEIRMRKCNVCSYETKHRTALVLHMLKHKSPAEIPMYKCDKCKFQTKFKHALKPHMIKHVDEAKD